MLKILILILSFSFAQAQEPQPAPRLNYGGKISSGYMQKTSPPSERVSYIEADFFLDYELVESLWSVRSSVLARVSDQHDYLGLQVTTPFFLSLPEVSTTTYLAPGYRYLNRGHHAPLIEGGFQISTAFGFGLGYRMIFNEWTENGLKDESQFFVQMNLNFSR